MRTTVASAPFVLVGALLFEWAGVPAGPLLGALAVSSVLALRNRPPVVPRRLRFLALAVLGWTLGAEVTPDSLQALAGHGGLVALTLATTLLASGMLALALTRYGPWDGATTLLACAPGGLAELIATADPADVNAELVLVVHLARSIAVVTAIPLAIRILAG